MPSYTQLYPEKWLKPMMIKGSRQRVTIAAIEVVEIRNPRINRKEHKLAVTFKGKEARLILNKTQCRALHAITGSAESDSWIGHTVILSVIVAPNDADTILISAPAEGAAATTTH